MYINIYRYSSLYFTFQNEYFYPLWQKRNFWHLALPMSHVYVWNCSTVHEGLINFKACDCTLCLSQAELCRNPVDSDSPSSRRIRHSQRVEKHCHLAPAHTAHPLHVSQPWIQCRLCDSKVQKRKGRTELTFLFSPSTNMRMCISQLLLICLRSQETHQQHSYQQSNWVAKEQLKTDLSTSRSEYFQTCLE